jgi:hypothetical protein
MYRVLVVFGLAVLMVACATATTAPRLEMTCAEGSVAPLAFRQYVRANGVTVDSFAVENRVTEPHRYADTVLVFNDSYRVILSKNGGKCQTLYDSLLARFNPPIVAELE